MLTTDLVRVRRRGGRIEARRLGRGERERLLAAAEGFVAAAQAALDRPRAAFEAACDDVPCEPTDYKLLQGLRKLVRDRCVFETRGDVDPPAVRRAVFARAAAVRRALDDGAPFEPGAVIAAAAAECGLPARDVPDALFADLKEHQVLARFDAIGGPALVAAYETAQHQAILLRAVRVVVTFDRPDPGGFRLFFRRLKFHRLLYVATRQPGGVCRIEIDGPFSLFRSVTAYGLQLALLLPALDACACRWELDAEILWGPERQALQLHLEGEPAGAAGGDARLPDEVARLRDRFSEMKTAWNVQVAHELLDVPGFGLCVPDLVFTHADTGHRVHFEALGYWSREAVWRRVELVEAGLAQPIVFAVSRRLRVSEEVLDENLPGQLYVYAGAISARAIEERLETSLVAARR